MRRRALRTLALGMDLRPPFPSLPSPSRQVECGDGVAWLRAAALTREHAVVTSMPDATETHGRDRAAWRGWFEDVAALICERVADEGVAVFYQTDVVEAGRWEDKAWLVGRGAARSGAACLFHQVVLRAPAGVATGGRPGYAHLLAFSRSLRLPRGVRGPDVVPRLGEMAWARGMGTEACEAVVRFLQEATSCRVVVDPFCGLGTMLAVANAYGLDAVGVERSKARAAKAATLRYRPGAGLA